MSSHQRRIFKRYQLRLKLAALLAFIRRQALRIMARAKSSAPKTVASMLAVAVDKLPMKAVAA